MLHNAFYLYRTQAFKTLWNSDPDLEFKVEVEGGGSLMGRGSVRASYRPILQGMIFPQTALL